MDNFIKYYDYFVLFFAIGNLIVGVRDILSGEVPLFISLINLMLSVYFFYQIKHHFIKE